MALRHPFPEAILAGMQLAMEPEETVPVMRKAKVIQFRKGKDLAEVCKEMEGYPRVQINAAVGSGKSTGLPVQLAEYTSKPVIHVVPSRLLCVSLYDFVSKTNPSVPITLALSPFDPIGTSGVTYTYAANVVAICMIKRVANAFKDMVTGAYLYLDEYHESDGYTKFVKRVAQKMGGVTKVVEATATAEPDRMMMAEMDGVCESQVFSATEKPSDWDPAEPNKPWSISSMDDNALIFLDDERVAQSLLEKYSRGGVTAYRLTARMSVDTFRQIIQQTRDPASGIVVLIADYSFRSGFTFAVSRIIDSAVVQYITIDNGEQVTRMRYAFRLERHQAQFRGGREKGARCIYFSPNIDQPNAICDLEGIEVELAATLFRMAGYLPPSEIANIAFMASGNIPADLVQAVNGSVALPLISKDLMIPLVKVVDDVSDVPDTVEELVDCYQESETSSPVSDYFSHVEFDETKVPKPASSGLDFLQQLRIMSKDNTVLLPGRYYKTPGVPNVKVESELYGSDWRLAMKELRDNDVLVIGMSRQHKLELIAMFLAEYNTQVAVSAGIDRMVEAKDKLSLLSVRYPDHVFRWSDQVSSELRESKIMQQALLDMLEMLRIPGMEFMPIMPDEALEKKIATSYAERLTEAVKGADRVIDGADYLKYIESKVPSVLPISDKPYDRLTVESETGDSIISVHQQPIRVGSSRRWDLTFKIAKGLMWSAGECEDALKYYLVSSGLSSHSINTVRFIGPKVDNARVLRKVVEMGELKHRQALTRKFTLRELDKGGGQVAGTPNRLMIEAYDKPASRKTVKFNS